MGIPASSGDQPSCQLPSSSSISSMNGRQFSSCQKCLASQKKTLDDEVDDEPIKFTGSAASKTMPHYLNEHVEDNPTSRTISIGLSLTAFMLWFFVLREESDWDDNISRSLYDRVDHLEKTNLITAINYYQRNGMDARPLVKRLKEIEEEEAAANAEGMATEARLTAARSQ